jgi:hypothetical protein
MSYFAQNVAQACFAKINSKLVLLKTVGQKLATLLSFSKNCPKTNNRPYAKIAHSGLSVSIFAS